MVTVQQLESGIADYLDEQLMPKLPSNSVYKVLIGAGTSIAIQRMGKMVDELKNNPIISALDLIDSDGNIDVDIIIAELKKQIPNDGIRFQANKFGKLDMVIKKDDMEELKRCIMENT